MENQEKIFNIYMFFVYLVILPLFLIFSTLYLFVLEVEEVDEIFIRFGFFGLLVSFGLGSVIFLYLFKYLKVTNNYSDFFKTFGAYIVFIPGLLIFFVGYSNVALDTSKTVYRDAQIVYKRNSTRVRKGQARDSYYIDVKSWKSSIDRISVKVSRNSFESLEVGDLIKVETKSGFWGIEYMNFSQN